MFMVLECFVTKTGSGSLQATGGDSISSLTLGGIYRAKITTPSARSLQHHRLYWGGLIALGLEYWEPAGGLVSNAERVGVQSFAAFLDDSAQSNGAVMIAAREYLEELTEARRDRVHPQPVTAKQFSDWALMEAGAVDRYETPAGIRVTPKSISFSKMDQREFGELYKAVFGVIWRYVLSRNFDNESDAQAVVDRLCAMG